MNDNEKPGSCSTRGMCSGFNYCFWAKMIVAIPAVPLIGVTVASFFSEPAWQFTMASYSGAVVVILAQYIDRMPLFSRMFKAKN